MVKLREWPRVPLVTAPRLHVEVVASRATNRTLPGVELYDQDNEPWEGNDDDAA